MKNADLIILLLLKFFVLLNQKNPSYTLIIYIYYILEEQ